MIERTPAEKGDALERAVRLVETAILRSFPNYSEKTFRIESNKTIHVNGVRHEIDLYVTVLMGGGYDSVFIFECKNWQDKDKVGKNDIIIFAAKIAAAGAQRGFFVAKAYSEDAIAQAKLEPRLERLRVEEFDPRTLAVPHEFHGLQVGEPTFRLNIVGMNATRESVAVPLVINTTVFELKGTALDLMEYIRVWGAQLIDERTKRFPSLQVDAGPHMLDLDDERVFANGEVVVNGLGVRSMKLSGIVEVHVAKAVIVSAFEIAARGRVITVQVDMPLVQLTADFVQFNGRDQEG